VIGSTPLLANVTCVLAATLGSRPTGAQDLNSTPAPPATPSLAKDQPWTFDAFVYLWFAGVSGNLTVKGQDVDLEGDGDGFSGETSLSGFLGHFEAHHGPWSYAFAPIFLNVETTGTQSGGVDAVVKIDAQIHEGFIAHELSSSWDWLAGARYYELDTGVDLSAGGVPIASPGSVHAWVDPIVGARYHTDFSEHWSLHARGDIGGFGVGSDFAWNASALVGYRFSSCCAAQLGYRALSLDFTDGSGTDRLAYDLTMRGPILGVSFSF
jgi:hypothetical protein